MARLAVHDLAVARGGWPVLTGVSFSVGPGEALILRGPNGAGKTTLLRCLAGLQPAQAGQIDGAEAETVYASHADGVKDALTVEENLAFWARVYGTTVPDWIWAAFDLTSLKHRPGGTLSAGQRRRLGLSRLGVVGRGILLLDEPTVSLDTASVVRFAQFLKDRHLASGGSAIIATHIDMGLDAPVLDIGKFAASEDAAGGSDEAFL